MCELHTRSHFNLLAGDVVCMHWHLDDARHPLLSWASCSLYVCGRHSRVLLCVLLCACVFIAMVTFSHHFYPRCLFLSAFVTDRASDMHDVSLRLIRWCFVHACTDACMRDVCMFARRLLGFATVPLGRPLELFFWN